MSRYLTRPEVVQAFRLGPSFAETEFPDWYPDVSDGVDRAALAYPGGFVYHRPDPGRGSSPAIAPWGWWLVRVDPDRDLYDHLSPRAFAARYAALDTPELDRVRTAVWEATLPFQEELRTSGGVTFMGLRNAVAEAVVAQRALEPPR